jgi:hypothetical protein
MRYELKTEREKGIAKTTATQISYMLRQLNRDDVIPLCAQFSRDHDGDRCVDPESVYGMVSGALAATLALLGVPLHSSKMSEAVQDMHDGVGVEDVLKTYAVHH